MYFEDFKLHDTIEIPPVPIEREAMLTFARKYDNISLHVDEAYAKTTRFGGLIAPGMFSYLEVWTKVLEADPYGDELIAGRSTGIEWIRPVYPGDTLMSRVEVTGLTERNEKNGAVELTVFTENQHGELVMTAVTEAVIKRRQPAGA